MNLFWGKGNEGGREREREGMDGGGLVLGEGERGGGSDGGSAVNECDFKGFLS